MGAGGGESELRYEILQNAYIKLVLHALKHKSEAVNGVLLGKVSPQNDAVVEIADSVPLFHTHLGLLPQLEISLLMIEEHYSAQGLQIVGYFHANERFDDAELGIVAKNIGDHIYRYFPQAAVLLLDNKKLEALPKEKNMGPVMQLYTRDAAGKWKPVGSDGNTRFLIKEPSGNIVLLDYISSGKWQDVVDFDDHLDDITKDWVNPELFKCWYLGQSKTEASIAIEMQETNFPIQKELQQQAQMLSSVSSLHPPSHDATVSYGDSRSNSQLPTWHSVKTNLPHNFNTPFELKQVHAHLVKTNTPLSILPLTRVALVCALSPHFLYAQQILNCVDGKPNAFAWNSCLKAFAESSDPVKAIMLFYQLREYDILPDEFTCSFALKACTSLNDISCGRIVHCYIEKLGFRFNTFLQNMLVHLYALRGEIGVAMLLFEKMSQRDVVTWNIMITQLTKRGDIEGAYELFLRMPERSVRSWTAMISGFVQCGKPNEAVSLFREMEDLGLRPNEVTVVAVLAACADLGSLDLGRKVHEYSNRSGFGRNVRICNTLIDMYVKCGCLENARRVFDEMEERTIVSWSAMIAGLAMHGKAEEALSLFHKMTQIGVKPNDVTIIGLLHACSHMGLIDEGRRFFARMTRDYNIVPRIEHYGCMVDLFSRAGLLQEAHEFIKNMPIKPNGVVWGALLGGCKVHKNIELAEEAIKHLAVLDPLNDGYYVVLSNIYAEAEQWEDVARVRKLMRDQGAKKKRAWSSITIDGEVHEFVAGDESHPQAEEIFQMWEQLLNQIKLKGYVPNTSVVLLDLEEKEKEKFLFRHSEKLALVFGLMNTPPGTPIRIMKNLRVCEDCHTAFKLISAIVNREIVVRDRNRFHCFKNGSCSCNDYW